MGRGGRGRASVGRGGTAASYGLRLFFPELAFPADKLNKKTGKLTT